MSEGMHHARPFEHVSLSRLRATERNIARHDVITSATCRTLRSTVTSMAKIELPDLESQTDVEIVKESLQAAQAIYFAYQLEEMRLFQVVERS